MLTIMQVPNCVRRWRVRSRRGASPFYTPEVPNASNANDRRSSGGVSTTSVTDRAVGAHSRHGLTVCLHIANFIVGCGHATGKRADSSMVVARRASGVSLLLRCLLCVLAPSRFCLGAAYLTPNPYSSPAAHPWASWSAPAAIDDYRSTKLTTATCSRLPLTYTVATASCRQRRVAGHEAQQNAPGRVAQAADLVLARAVGQLADFGVSVVGGYGRRGDAGTCSIADDALDAGALATAASAAGIADDHFGDKGAQRRRSWGRTGGRLWTLCRRRRRLWRGAGARCCRGARRGNRGRLRFVGHACIVNQPALDPAALARLGRVVRNTDAHTIPAFEIVLQ